MTAFNRNLLSCSRARKHVRVEPNDERLFEVPRSAAIGVVATILAGQLWTLTAALDAWLRRDDRQVVWILLFQIASFGVAISVWAITAKGRR